MDEWINGWIDGWMDERIIIDGWNKEDGWTNR